MKPLVPAIFLLLTSVAIADDGRTYATQEAAEAVPAFALQGEYVGGLSTDDGEKKRVGVQVIALGDDQFRAVGYVGGLPGDGWDGEKPESVEAKADGGKVVFAQPDRDLRGILSAEGLAVDSDGEALGTLPKVERESPTLGKAAPDGALVLFDGSGTEAWNGGALTEDGHLKQGATSKETFGDHSVHLEFRTPFQPKARGQGRGNSGVYLQGRHEVQVLDSFGLAGENNECGGIYSVAAPKVNMCFPPLAWQTYDIDFTAAKYDADGKKSADARMTVRHNGVVIHDEVEVPGATTAAPESEEATDGPLFLQDHGNPVAFRNIWVVRK
ncbi:hypothetical protein BH23VER1_BH23VER1_08660 [soil metagenome]